MFLSPFFVKLFYLKYKLKCVKIMYIDICSITVFRIMAWILFIPKAWADETTAEHRLDSVQGIDYIAID